MSNTYEKKELALAQYLYMPIGGETVSIDMEMMWVYFVLSLVTLIYGLLFLAYVSDRKTERQTRGERWKKKISFR